MEINMNMKIFKFAYREALIDAMMHNDSGVDKEAISSNDEAMKIVKKYIDNTLEGKNTDIIKACQAYIAKVDSRLSLGYAQKIINMTAKYLYMGCYFKPELREKFARFECPMDSQMIRKVVNDYRDIDPCSKLLRIEYEDKKATDSKWSEFSWHKLKNNNVGIKNYKNFQEMVKILANNKKMYPIEYDFCHYE